ncbi:primosomal protein N' [Lacicoccus qingdaonensis]|uniref:Replication restart protein PriA n=1 Tax=Lacicoccus qingdaonensis TaxID=576118 RepID=A0A1G9A4N1_9BACL|nr:primosomal protein N' [Salinicoccus qingdaonensis]SDK22349.1 replication restart DNA helicase PriA [Salinicoccus qingdaonensis]
MYASIIVSVSASDVNKVFEYKIPDGLTDFIAVGHRVLVPFGPRQIQGYVIDIKNEVGYDPSKIKPITRALDVKPVLTAELIKLAKDLADYYVTSYISVIETILPAALKSKSKKMLSLSEDSTEQTEVIWHGMNLPPKIEVKTLSARQLAELKPLIRRGEVEEETIITQHTKKKYARALKPTFIPRGDFGRAYKQLELLDFIEQYDEHVLQSEVIDNGYTQGTINELVKKGYVEKVDVVSGRDPYKSRVFEEDLPKELNAEQQNAYDKISHSVDHDLAETFLLHGVTGSGKTEVYLQVIQKVLDKERTALMLVPEIALTPQMVNRFKARFGDDVAVLHSGLSHGEKYDEWLKVKNQQAGVVVGARSSVFAPVENLGVIIIDEEHETTYKQQDRPMYHATEVAKYRSKYYNCPVILGSATPSLESFARSERGVYTRLELNHRAVTKTLPETKTVDMSEEHRKGNTSIVSEALREAINLRIGRGEQTVLLLNRRGYANFQICQSCGHVPNCPNCDISLTYHKMQHSLLCHYCGYEAGVTRECDNCDSDDVTFRGTGTEKVEETLRDMFNVDIVRMDNDTTSRKGMHEKLLNTFENEKIPILLGTQMIAKGLDYPNVTLVGVLNADTMLNLPDFRANEKTYQLLTQVAGRAGRHELSGEVIFQTYNPEHYAIELAESNDYAAFYEKELAFRRLARYSPYYFHVLFTVSHEQVKKCLEATTHIHKELVDSVTDKAIIVGPSPSPIERINRQYRFQILLKYKSEPNLIDVLHKINEYYNERYKKDKLSLKIDVDPKYIM